MIVEIIESSYKTTRTMKRHLTFLLIAFLVCFGAKAQVEKTNLRVLYVSGHSDIETMGMASYGAAAYDKSVV